MNAPTCETCGKPLHWAEQCHNVCKGCKEDMKQEDILRRLIGPEIEKAMANVLTSFGFKKK